MEEIVKYLIDKFSFWQLIVIGIFYCAYRFCMTYGKELMEKCELFTKHFSKLENDFKKHEQIDLVRHNEIKEQLDDVMDYLTGVDNIKRSK